MRLKDLRIASGTTQKDVAESIGCTATIYSRYEREEREPDIQTLCKLANYFQVSIDYLVESDSNIWRFQYEYINSCKQQKCLARI